MFQLTKIDISDPNHKCVVAWLLSGFLLLLLLGITGFVLGRKYITKLLVAGKIKLDLICYFLKF
jgi:hypothetical protein